MYKNEVAKVAELLGNVGLKRNIARTLAYLREVDESTAVEIERNAELRQPEVSNAVQFLQRKNWILRREAKKEGKGRPVYIYRLSKNFSKIVEELVAEQKDYLKKTESILAKLREYQ